MRFKSVLSFTAIIYAQRKAIVSGFALLVCAVWLFQPPISVAQEPSSVLSQISSHDALLVVGPGGRIIYSKNEARKCVPASTLKVLTALAAIHHLGKSYRFQTEFYQDHDQNLKIKGYGDPLLITEVWQEIAKTLSSRLQGFKDLVLDSTILLMTYVSQGLSLPPMPIMPRMGRCVQILTRFLSRWMTRAGLSQQNPTPP